MPDKPTPSTEQDSISIVIPFFNEGPNVYHLRGVQLTMEASQGSGLQKTLQSYAAEGAIPRALSAAAKSWAASSGVAFPWALMAWAPARK